MKSVNKEGIYKDGGILNRGRLLPAHGSARAARREKLDDFHNEQNAKRVAEDIERRRNSRPAFKNALIALRTKLH